MLQWQPQLPLHLWYQSCFEVEWHGRHSDVRILSHTPLTLQFLFSSLGNFFLFLWVPNQTTGYFLRIIWFVWLDSTQNNTGTIYLSLKLQQNLYFPYQGSYCVVIACLYICILHQNVSSITAQLLSNLFSALFLVLGSRKAFNKYLLSKQVNKNSH